MKSIYELLDVADVTRIAEPIRITEFEGGKYDGDYRVEARCPGCGNTTVHIMARDNYGPCHRIADCGNGCRGGYNMVRPLPGPLGAVEWWKDAERGLSVNESGPGPGLLEYALQGVGDA